MLAEVPEFVAILASTLFTGAAIYINLVEHPARMRCGTEIAATVWAPSYQRATVMQVTLGILSTVAGLTAWLLGLGLMWLVGALLIFCVIPLTLIAVMPTNKQLLNPELDHKSEATGILLQKWARLHAVRSLPRLVASIIFILSR